MMGMARFRHGLWLGPLLVALPAFAAEKGYIIRATDLMEKPFIDAGKTGTVAANEPMDITLRQGAWIQVQGGGKSGWVRALNLRMGSAIPPDPKGRTNASLLTTGSSGRTVTTGVKGLDEENIRNASPSAAQLDELNTLGASPEQARALAASDKLQENSVNYLKKGKAK